MSDPAALYAQSLRDALIAAGLERRELNGHVYFTNQSSLWPMVLAHGVNDHAGTWAPVVALLAQQYRLVVPDLAGHGESSPLDGPIELTSLVDGLATIVDREIEGTFTLVGNSMGAWVSILYVLGDRRQRVSRLVLESGGGLGLPLGVPLIARTSEEAVRILRAVHGPDVVLPEWAVDALLRRAEGSPLLRMVQAGAFQHTVDERLHELDVPTTVVWGEHDGVVPREYVEALRTGIRGARLQVVPGAAHIPHLQQPARFVACLNSIS